MDPRYDPQKARFVERAEDVHFKLTKTLSSFPVSIFAEVMLKADYFQELGGEFSPEMHFRFVQAIVVNGS